MTWKERPFTQWASIHRTDRGISVEPLSGYRIVQREDEGYVIYLPPDAADDVLGRALLQALDKSRFIWPLDPEFDEAERYLRCFRNWRQNFTRRYGYKTKRDAYKTMDWCEAQRSEGKISIEPRKRIKPEHWQWLSPNMNVVIPATRNAVAVGAALRQGFDRCGDWDGASE